MSYESIVEYYDLLHATLTYDIDFISRLTDKKGKDVLELGCGTGRLLLPLARNGHNVVGLDNSAAMLKKAKEKISQEPIKVKERVILIEGDMTSFVLNHLFHLILIPHNTLMHLSFDQAQVCFRHCRRHIASDGVLYIDVDNPFELADPRDDNLVVMEKAFDLPERGLKVLQMASSWVNTEAQIRHTTWIFDAMPEKGGSVNRSITKMNFHYHFPHQLEILLQEAGFAVTSLYGNYAGDLFDADSSKLIILAAPVDAKQSS